jgi:hypothetical protein
VVAVGLTLVEPLADAEVNAPGVMARLVAPLVAQLRTLLEPEVIVAGLAVKELMVGLLQAMVTTMVTVAVVVPEVPVIVTG